MSLFFILNIFLIVIILLIANVAKVKKFIKVKNNMIEEGKKIFVKYNVDEFGKRWDGYNKNIKVMHSIYTDRTLWSPRLKLLDELLPEGMCLDNMSTVEDDTKLDILLIALAEKQEGFDEVKTFIGSLERNPLFDKGAKLGSQRRATLEEKEINLFNITIPLTKKQVEVIDDSKQKKNQPKRKPARGGKRKH